MLLLKKKWRQEAQDGILSAVEQQTLSKRLFDDGSCRDVEHEPLDEAPAADFFRGSIGLRDSLQLLLQICADTCHVLQQVLFLKNRQIFQSDAASQRAPAKRGAMLANGNCRCKLLPGQECTQRNSRSNRLGDRHAARHSCKNSTEHSRMPPSPKIGSSTMAQVLSLTAARRATTSLR